LSLLSRISPSEAQMPPCYAAANLRFFDVQLFFGVAALSLNSGSVSRPLATQQCDLTKTTPPFRRVTRVTALQRHHVLYHRPDSWNHS
jgi:hypothetical protein